MRLTIFKRDTRTPFERDRDAGHINFGEDAACFCPYDEHPSDEDGRGHPDGDADCCNNPIARRIEAGKLDWRVANRWCRTRTIPPDILAEFDKR